MKKVTVIFLTTLLTELLLSQSALPLAPTTLHNIRLGHHTGFTRLVFDSEGARPLRIGPATEAGVRVVYEQLNLATEPERLFRKYSGAAAKVSHHREPNASVVTIAFTYPNTEVRTFFMPAKPPKKRSYHLILDFYPRGSPAGSAGAKVPYEKVEIRKPAPKPETVPTEPVEEQVAKEEIFETKEGSPAESSGEDTSTAETQLSRLSGEAGVTVRAADGEDDSSKFEEYRDISGPITGAFNVAYEKKDRYSLRFDAEDLAEDDQHLNFTGNRYGMFKLGIDYDRIPHRYAFDAKTLYSGVGTANLTLDDAMQTRLQNATSTIDAEFNNAVSGDPEVIRDKVKAYMDLTALDPLSLRVEFGKEYRDGTRPSFGSFGTASTTVEIFEPLDHETTEMKVIAEYAKRPFFLNATYYFSDFKNNVDTLTWDNPFSVVDALFAASKGLIDLAPDNQFHNVSISGSYMDLPLKTRISATAAWGWMKQDDALVPFTTNTAIAAPNLPKQSVDAKVETSLYNVLLTARPLSFMRVKGKLRYFEYDNHTERIRFPGSVSSDDFFSATPIVNLPTSYRKTKGGLDLSFDVYRKTRLNLGYTTDQTRRTNREVSRQKDDIFSGSVDTSPYPWLDLRASYERTERDISDYDFDPYLEGGKDLQQLPLLRKYTQADVARDRVQFLATVYPSKSLAVSGSFIHGNDDFKDSPYGLLEDKHFILSLDADYSISDRLNLSAFYSYERYENMQKGRGPFDGGPDTDWIAEGEDMVNTVGWGISFAVIPEKLDFDLSYSYSDVDGDIHFVIPAGSASDFTTVDETRLHILDVKSKYTVRKNFFVTLGYLWENFDFEDFNTAGLTYTPQGAVLAGTLPKDYNVNLVYTRLSYRF